MNAIVNEPRECYVPERFLWSSTDDRPIALNDEGTAIMPGLSFFLIAFRLLGLAAGDTVLAVGAGAGYGAALARPVVGSGGRVRAVEADEDCGRRAHKLLADWVSIDIVFGLPDFDEQLEPGFAKGLFTYEAGSLSEILCTLLPVGGRVVAPISCSDGSLIELLVKNPDGSLGRSRHAAKSAFRAGFENDRQSPSEQPWPLTL